MQAAQRAAARGGVVVLDEADVESGGRELGGVVDLEEEAAIVAVDRRLDQEDPGRCTSRPSGRRSGSGDQNRRRAPR